MIYSRKTALPTGLAKVITVVCPLQRSTRCSGAVVAELVSSAQTAVLTAKLHCSHNGCTASEWDVPLSGETPPPGFKCHSSLQRAFASQEIRHIRQDTYIRSRFMSKWHCCLPGAEGGTTSFFPVELEGPAAGLASAFSVGKSWPWTAVSRESWLVGR